MWISGSGLPLAYPRPMTAQKSCGAPPITCASVHGENDVRPDMIDRIKERVHDASSDAALALQCRQQRVTIEREIALDPELLETVELGAQRLARP